MLNFNKFFLVLCVLTLCLANFIPAALTNEALRIAGMGGAFIGISSVDAGVFGNPATLVDVKANNLSFAFSVENFRYDELSEAEDKQFASNLVLRSKPSVYYSRAYRDMGFSVGYLSDWNNTAKFTIENTQSSYIVNERRFEAETPFCTRYDTLWENGVALGFSKRLQTAIVGMRIKILRQTAKRGQLISSLRLESIHGEDVNPNDPRQLIPAIIDNLELKDGNIKDAIRPDDEVELDLSDTGLDVDFGAQTAILTKKLNVNGLTAGFILTNVLHRKLAAKRHSELGIGLGYEPLPWITTGLDLRKQFAEKGLTVNFGWEIRGKWQRGASIETAVRNGFDISIAQKRFALGFLLALGNSYWEYTLTKQFKGESYSEANHTLASTICF
ncbi:hypothetical protein FJZ31_02590 [Candidatus Poribacteria bacterium]|nr:hypothetical protein [Candidatus Poribacteria bacterium]